MKRGLMSVDDLATSLTDAARLLHSRANYFNASFRSIKVRLELPELYARDLRERLEAVKPQTMLFMIEPNLRRESSSYVLEVSYCTASQQMETLPVPEHMAASVHIITEEIEDYALMRRSGRSDNVGQSDKKQRK